VVARHARPAEPPEAAGAASGGSAAPRPEGAPDAYLTIERLSKRFGDFTALSEVSLAIGRGEFVCFLGPSGCGKTTLLRAIAGLDPQTSGTIVQDGRDISLLPPGERDFGIVFQSYALFPNLTVAANVGYGLRSRRLARAAIERKVADLLDLVGLADQAAKYPAQLSGGQQQRVALARALALDPGLLLLDEPLSALDARVRVYLRHELKALQRRLGVTTIMVTHDQEEALTLADRIVVMNHGVVEQVGTPRRIYAEPASRFVADFVGTMNFLDGIAVGADRVRIGGHELAAAPGTPGPGARVTLCLRPEDVAVRGVAPESENAIAVRVTEVEFLGPVLRARLALAGTPDAVLRADFSMNAVRDLGIAEGADLVVGLPRRHLRVFAAE
jgi:iron(III) transport system ATP-binding protein